MHIFQTRQISLKTSLWMMSYEVFQISAIFGAAKATSNFFIKKKLKITSHLVEFYEHGKL